MGERLRPSGGYRKLRSFQAATIIYDATVSFCDRFLDKRSRTVDQMVQAARSGRQNIAEGSRASATSSNTELRLVNIARASLDELLLDYEDFLRQRGKRQWDKNAREARAVRAVGRERSPVPAAAYSPWLSHADPAVVANAVICLIHQANYLLDQQISALERSFIREGGYSETSRLHGSRSGGGRKIRPIRPIRPIGRMIHPPPLPFARLAARAWCCAPPARGLVPGRGSGVAPAIRSAWERGR
jgi:restriction system protein